MSISQDLHTIGDYIRWAVSQFNASDIEYGQGFDNGWDEAVFLVLGKLSLPWDIDREVWSARLTTDERKVIIEAVHKRINDHVPIAYLVGRAWFMGLEFVVDERVLIPRSPVAELIESRFTPWLTDRPVRRVLDLCTGSGCIGIACAYQFEEATVDLSDISTDALQVAMMNISLHQQSLGDRVHLIHSDLFNNIPPVRYDLIVSNPPYVDQEDFDHMPVEFAHEPVLGLVSGRDGLDATRRILARAGDFLMDDGILVVEVGDSQWALMDTFPEVPFTWLDLERGGKGVFLLTAAQCRAIQSDFREWQ